jgi:uncharacterized membrane protein YphA (DoxX/SURF4 family)
MGPDPTTLSPWEETHVSYLTLVILVALVLCIMAAIGRLPLWIAVMLICLALLFQSLTGGRLTL